MKRKINYSPQEKILRGVEKLYKAVSPTLGPLGQTVLIETRNIPHPTKDGITVAKQVILNDATENLAATIVKTASATVMDRVGDGSTSVQVLTYNLLKNSYKSDMHPVTLSKQLDNDLKVLTNAMSRYSSPISSTEDMYSVAFISCNNDHEQAKLVLEAYDQARESGMILVGDSNTTESFVSKSKGYHISSTYSSPYFITDSTTNECVLENPLVFLTTKRLSVLDDVRNSVELALKTNRPLFIIAQDADYQVITTLVHNMRTNNLKVCVVQPPAFGIRNTNILEDIASITNSQVINEDKGFLLKNQLDYLGAATKITVNKSSTIIESEHSDIEYVDKLKTKLANSEDAYNREDLTERIAKLTNGIITINVYANTKSEALELKDRLDDGIRAVRAALKKGVSTGSGITYLKLQNEDISDVSKKSLDCIYKQLLTNCNLDYNLLIPIIKQSNYTKHYNMFTNEIEDIPSYIIDPTLSLLVILEQAYTATKLLLTTAVTIEEDADVENYRD